MCSMRKEPQSLALQLGATAARVIETEKLPIEEQFRALCAQNTCGRYGKAWQCPPHLPPLAQCALELRAFPCALVVQRVYDLKDDYDWPGMMAAKENFDDWLRRVRDALRTAGYANLLPLGAGGCALCQPCAYPDSCRHPDAAFASMEGYGLNVTEVMRNAGIPYRFGNGQVQYCGLIAFLP